MNNIPEQNKAYRLGFILLPEFSTLAFASAVEPLRVANRISGQDLFQWECYSEDGLAVTGSAGLAISVQGKAREMPKLPLVFVCGGLEVQKHTTPAIISLLRRIVSHGSEIGAICTGTYVIAKAGLLDGYRATIHWENLPSLREDFPELDITSELFEIDRNRYSCAGGTASLDMMLSFISSQCGYDMAVAVADRLIHHRIRDGHERQRMELRARLGISHPKLLAAISCMEENLEEPLTCSELATRVDLSTRQLERLFRKYLEHSPTRYYLGLRLNQSRNLLTQTSLPIIEIALACGFVSASHFSKCHREYFGRTPSEERRARR